jgi:hypothetical protein
MSNYYSQENIQFLLTSYLDAMETYDSVTLALLELQEKLQVPEAQEFLNHGVHRRMKIIRRCIENIFNIYPLNRAQPLSEAELSELCINLHAFFVDLFGVFDNLAWTKAHERNLPALSNRFKIGMYKKASKTSTDLVANDEVVGAQLGDYLNSELLLKWQNEHLKEFRDALAHRIPLYVPPYAVNDDGAIINPAPYFTHGTSYDGVLVLHPQLIADFNTVTELIGKFIELEFSGERGNDE